MINRQALQALDQEDELRSFRDLFLLPQGYIYLDGNSLGAMPGAAPARVRAVVEQEWGQDLIASWNKHGWIDLQQRVGAKIGRLIGADEGETIVADSTSVNLFKVLAAALQLRPDRTVIVSERSNFPTDLYIAQGLIAMLGNRHQLKLVEPGEVHAAIDDSVAVVMLTHVNYHTGAMHDLAAVTARAHAAGALTVWDLAHSAGAVPVNLRAASADFAVGCGYKYLNGGPGAPAFLYVAREHLPRLSMPLTGWFGHAQPFAFEPQYRPATGITRTLVGTPPIISLAALEVGVDIMLQASMDALRAKSIRQSELFIALVEQELGGHGFTLASPRDAARRGGQVCLRHPQAWPISQALIAEGVVGDFRAPDVLRLGFTPLYLGYTELWDAIATLRGIMQKRSWDQPQFHAMAKVT